jgi:hypothetical protein
VAPFQALGYRPFRATKSQAVSQRQMDSKDGRNVLLGPQQRRWYCGQLKRRNTGIVARCAAQVTLYARNVAKCLFLVVNSCDRTPLCAGQGDGLLTKWFQHE